MVPTAGLLTACPLPSTQVPAGSAAHAQAVVSREGGLLLAEYGHLEKALHVEAVPSEAAPQQALTPEGAERLITLLLTLPHGVLKNSHAVEGAASNRGAGSAVADSPGSAPTLQLL